MFIEIIGVITILMAIRAVVARDRAEKLLYINGCNILYNIHNRLKCDSIHIGQPR